MERDFTVTSAVTNYVCQGGHTAIGTTNPDNSWAKIATDESV